jgi:hypothetical protein
MHVKIYNSLPPEIKYLSHNIKKFKSFLRSFLHQHSFYTLYKYFNYGAVVWYILTNKLILFCLWYEILGMFSHVRQSLHILRLLILSDFHFILHYIKGDTVHYIVLFIVNSICYSILLGMTSSIFVWNKNIYISIYDWFSAPW